MSNDIAITLPEFAVAAAAGIGWGWAWTESGFFRPARRFLDRWFPEEIEEGHGWKAWVAKGSHCPACVGFYLQLLLITEAGGVSVWTIPAALAAVLVHLAWLQIVLTLTAIQLR